MGSNFLINAIFSLSMASMWSMLEVVQIIVFVPLFVRLKFPANAQTLNQSLIQVVTFDIVNTKQWIDPLFVTWGDNGTPFSHTFEECGFETTWFLHNSSTIVWIYILHFALFLVYLLVKAIYRRCGRL